MSYGDTGYLSHVINRILEYFQEKKIVERGAGDFCLLLDMYGKVIFRTIVRGFSLFNRNSAYSYYTMKDQRLKIVTKNNNLTSMRYYNRTQTNTILYVNVTDPSLSARGWRGGIELNLSSGELIVLYEKSGSSVDLLSI